MAIVVLVTVPQAKAKTLAKKILKTRLCACVNIIKGVDSLFWWQGKIDRAKEALLIMKTQRKLFRRLAGEIKKHHPYTVPEIISLTIDGITSDYKKWLKEETNG